MSETAYTEQERFIVKECCLDVLQITLTVTELGNR